MRLGLGRIIKATKPFGRQLAIVATALGILIYALLAMRWDALEVATDHATGMATALAQGVANSIATIDLVLRDAEDIVRVETDGEAINAEHAARIRQALKSRHEALPETELIAIANEAGDVVTGASDGLGRPINIADREYFQELRDSTLDHMAISKPLPNRLNGAMTIMFARRLKDKEGRFVGVAFVGISPQALFKGRQTPIADDDRSYSLAYADGLLALREPVGRLQVGQSIRTSSAWSEVASKGGGLFHTTSVFDGLARYVAVRKVPGSPFFVNVGITDRLAFAQWRFRAATILGVCFVGAALILGQLRMQAKLSNRLSRSRLRDWLRSQQLAAQQAELRKTRDRFGATLDYMSQGMGLFDAHRILIASNKSFAELYSLSPNDLRPGMHLDEIYALRIAANAFAGESGEAYLPSRERYRAKLDQIDRLRNGRVIHVRGKMTDEGGRLTVHEDITDRIRAEEELLLAARQDPLTHLPNRRGFREELEQWMEAADNEKVAVLLTDIIGFREVNEVYGYDIGDGVLQEAAKRLSAETQGGFVARLGSDEFVALARVKDDALAEALDLGGKLIKAIREPMEIDGRRISLGLNVGVKIAELKSCDFERVMRSVNVALVTARKAGPNTIRAYDDEMERIRLDKAKLALDLRLAISRDELEVHYQPIVEPTRGEVVCMEALARWRHPTRGMVPPLAFIPLAEEMGLIDDIGDWILRRACRDAALWRSDVVLAVNISSLQVERDDYVATVKEALACAGLAPHRLQLEITESVLLRNNEATRDHLIAIRAMGVTFALDDFGTGYASLSYLKAFPLDKIKIDKTFVDDICVNPQSAAIVGAIVSLANGIGVWTTAEGVETQEQVEALRTLGVSTMQGYYFSKPKAIQDHDPALVFCVAEKRDADAA